MAYGAEELRGEFGRLIRDFCTALAKNGMVAVIPDYFSATGTAPGLNSAFAPANDQERWVVVLKDAVANTFPGTAPGRTALVGFSLGGHLALKAAIGPSAKAVVDFFGPLATGGSAITSATAMPPVQIHHGEDDSIVVFSNSVTLDAWLNSESIVHEFHRYPGNGHPGQELVAKPPGWSTQAQSDATTASVQFLAAHI